MSKIFTINNYEVIGNYFGFLTSLWEMWQLNTLKLDIKLFKECLKLQTSVRKSFGSEILTHFVLWIDLPVELKSHLTYEPMDNALQIFAFCNCSCGWFLVFFQKLHSHWPVGYATAWKFYCHVTWDKRLFVRSLYNVSGSLCWISFNIMTELTVACFSHETRKDYSLFMSFKY